MTRRTRAPILVWCRTCHRKMSPALIRTRSKSRANMVLCVLLPLPGIPTTTYLRIVRTMTHLVPHCQPLVVVFVSRATGAWPWCSPADRRVAGITLGIAQSDAPLVAAPCPGRRGDSLGDG